MADAQTSQELYDLSIARMADYIRALAAAQATIAAADVSQPLAVDLTALVMPPLDPLIDPAVMVSPTGVTAGTPVAPNISFDYRPLLYVSTVRTPLMNAMLAGLRNGGVGVGAVSESAQWDREKEKDLLSLQEATDEAADDAAGAGFMTPPGQMNVKLLTLHRDLQAKRLAASIKIAEEQVERAEKQTETYIEQALALEAAMKTSWGSERDRALKAAQVEPRIMILIYQARVQEIISSVDAYNSLIAVFKARVDAYEAEIKAFSANARARAAVNTGNALKYMAETETAVANTTEDIGKLKVAVEELQKMASLQIEVIKAKAHIESQITSAAKSMINYTAGWQASRDGNEYVSGGTRYSSEQNGQDILEETVK